MSARSFRPTVVALILALPASALGQGAAAPAGTTTAAPSPTPSPAPGNPAAGTAPAAGAPETAAPRPPAREATGYAPESIRSAAGGGGSSRAVKAGKAGKPAKAGGVSKSSQSRKAQTGAAVVEPGFSLLESGGSRFFVELGQAVPIEQRKAKGSITFVLKGAHNSFRNNLNPLVTEHFNTPVRRAKLQRAGKDLLFVMEMRQDVAATHQIVTNKEGHSVFQVDFAAGTFVKDSPAPLPEPTDDASGGQGATEGAAPAGAGNRAGPKP